MTEEPAAESSHGKIDIRPIAAGDIESFRDCLDSDGAVSPMTEQQFHNQPTPVVTREDVLRVVRRDFSGTAEAEIIAILDLYGEADWQRERERVQLAILKLAAGDLDALCRATDTACLDYRDVLAPAEFPGYMSLNYVANPDEKEKEKRDKAIEGDWKQYEDWLRRE